MLGNLKLWKVKVNEKKQVKKYMKYSDDDKIKRNCKAKEKGRKKGKDKNEDKVRRNEKWCNCNQRKKKKDYERWESKT